MVNDTSQLISAYSYDGNTLFADSIEFSRLVGSASAIIPLKYGGKWSFYNRAGKMIIAPQFEDVPGFYVNGLAAVNQNGEVHLINTTGAKKFRFRIM
ncbi:MAG: WG repeat-containing protein [Bacteroidetes bacterium]|nr:WG repeat-containing protein [Bacteroidota bacterium]